MALADRYGSGFLAGTKGQTFAAGYDVKLSGVNDAGTLVHAGTPASNSPIQNVLTADELADDVGTSFGSKVVSQDGTTGDFAGVTKAVSGGTLAYQADATEWVVRGGNVTTALGGVANDQLIGGGRDYTGSLNDSATEAARVIIDSELVGASGFNIFAAPSTDMVPGRTRMANAGTGFSFVNPADGTAAVATEIAPSRSVPGELVYRDGSAEPVQKDYKASDAAEE